MVLVSFLPLPIIQYVYSTQMYKIFSCSTSFLYGSLIIERQENIAKKHYLIKEQIKQLFIFFPRNSCTWLLFPKVVLYITQCTQLYTMWGWGWVKKWIPCSQEISETYRFLLVYCSHAAYLLVCPAAAPAWPGENNDGLVLKPPEAVLVHPTRLGTHLRRAEHLITATNIKISVLKKCAVR